MDRPNRRVSNRYLRHLLQAIEDEMGRQSLRMVLRQAGLERYVTQLPKLDNHAVAYASELAALQQSICTYYGSGARGSLNRIGHAAWKRSVGEAAPGRKIRLHLNRWMPLDRRTRGILAELTAEIRGAEGEISLIVEDPSLLIIDQISDFTYGQSDVEAICWVTQGMIEEALAWGRCHDFEVEEYVCRATGAAACKFRIQQT
jgi:hypothetical protein